MKRDSLENLLCHLSLSGNSTLKIHPPNEFCTSVIVSSFEREHDYYKMSCVTCTYNALKINWFLVLIAPDHKRIILYKWSHIQASLFYLENLATRLGIYPSVSFTYYVIFIERYECVTGEEGIHLYSRIDLHNSRVTKVGDFCVYQQGYFRISEKGNENYKNFLLWFGITLLVNNIKLVICIYFF